MNIGKQTDRDGDARWRRSGINDSKIESLKQSNNTRDERRANNLRTDIDHCLFASTTIYFNSGSLVLDVIISNENYHCIFLRITRISSRITVIILP